MMKFEVFLVYYAREHTEIPTERVVNIARRVYDHLEDKEPVLNPGEKLENVVEKNGLELNQNIDKDELFKMTLTNELKEESVEWSGQLRKHLENEMAVMEEPSKPLDFKDKDSVTLTQYTNPDINSNNYYSYDIDCLEKSDAELILSSIKDQIDKNGACSLFTLASLFGISSPNNSLKYFGWKELSNSEVQIKTICSDPFPIYTLDLPGAIFLD